MLNLQSSYFRTNQRYIFPERQGGTKQGKRTTRYLTELARLDDLAQRKFRQEPIHGHQISPLIPRFSGLLNK